MLRSRKRQLWIALVVLLIAAAIAFVVYLRRRAAPEAARLLPEADAVVYVNLHLMRLAQLFQHATPVAHDPEYERFVQATGIQLERDLDHAAFAVHAAGSPLNRGAGGTGSFTDRARFSEIFIGRFDRARLRAYLRSLSQAVDTYRDTEVYAIPHEGRTVRVAILGVDTVAVSNVQEPAVLQQMIEKYRAAALPFSGPPLLAEYYHHVPLGSVAWAIARFAPPSSNAGALPLPGGLEVASSAFAGSVVVASARYLGSLQLRVEDFAVGEANASQLAEMARTYLALFKGVESSVQGGGADADVNALFDSLKVEQHGDRVVLTATIPAGFITKALTGSPTYAPTAPAPAPAPPEKSKAAPKRGRPK